MRAHVRELIKYGDVAKWSKAAVCKTAIRGFKSHRRLKNTCRGDGIGRHAGLKIQWSLPSVRVRVPPSAIK